MSTIVVVASGQQVTTVGVEHSLAQITGVGVYILEVDLSNMAGGDTVSVSTKDICLPGDTLKVSYKEEFTGVQSVPNIHSIPIPIPAGSQISCSITQTVGISNSFNWNLKRM